MDVTLHVAPGIPHNAAFCADFHPRGQAVIDAVARFVGAHLR